LSSTTIWDESELITKNFWKKLSKMKIETDLKIIIECFEAVIFAYKRYQTGINEHKISPEPLILQ